MKTAHPLGRLGLCALASALALVLLPAAHAGSPAALQPLADKKAPALPLSHSFGKGTPGENGGPYAVTLKNTSDKTLTLNASIVWSVASHNRANTIKLPARKLGAGESWTINDLAVEDRVVVMSEGYEKLELVTPPAK